jgi:uncharacterized repeat protein (TIGR01451 family)
MIPYRPLIGLASAVLALTLNSVFAPPARAVFVDGGFESGAANVAPPAPWTVTTYSNLTGFTLQTPQTLAGLNLAAGGAGASTVILTATTPLSQADADLGTSASLRWPRYGNACAIVNQHGLNKSVNSLSQTMTVSAGDVDPIDGLVHVRLAVAPLTQYPDHPPSQNPYGFIQLVNVTRGNSVLYSDFYASVATNIPWKKVNGGTASEIDYTDWQLVDIAPGSAVISVGDTVMLTIIASGCQLGGHWGEMYVDGVGMTPPGIFVTGTASLSAGNNCTYTFIYRNAGTAAESGVVITFTTPANSTFQYATPPAGAVNLTPPVGSAGVVTANFVNPLPAGAVGSFTVTVNLDSATLGTTVVFRNYQISSSQETPLLGPPISTAVPILPTASTSTVTDLTATTATLSGSVNPGGGAATAYFQYGTTTSYGSSSASTNLAATSTPLAVTSLISGLTSSTTYHCRLVAVNTSGTATGPDQTFTTGAGPVSFTLSNISPLPGGGFWFGFTNLGGLNFEVLGTTNLDLPLSNWMLLGPAVENPPGQYQFTNPGAANAGQGFFRVRSP